MCRVTTWNMEGATHKGDSKWIDFVPSFFKSDEVNGDFASIQEAGPVPASAVPVAAPAWAAGAAAPAGSVFGVYSWKVSSSLTLFIFWFQTDPGGNRVNLAVVSPRIPTNLWYAAPGLAGGRPAIGMSDANYANPVWSLHAFSGGGGDAPGLIANIQAVVGAIPLSLYALGDYNREPTPAWAVPAGTAICPPNMYTRWKSKKKLDYAVRTGLPVTGRVIEQPLSDHYPVVFDL